MQSEKMAAEEMLFRQHAMTQFPFKGDIPASDTYSQLQSAYGEACTCASRVRMWVCIERRNTDVAYRPRRGRPPTASMHRNKGKVD